MEGWRETETLAEEDKEGEEVPADSLRSTEVVTSIISRDEEEGPEGAEERDRSHALLFELGFVLFSFFWVRVKIVLLLIGAVNICQMLKTTHQLPPTTCDLYLVEASPN